MGREACCRCDWGAGQAHVKALLESNELKLQGGLKRKFPFAELKDVAVHGDRLEFRVGDEQVSLALGAGIATRWAMAITDPPSLAKKLGINGEERIRCIGEVNDPALRAALAQTALVAEGVADLVLAIVRTPGELDAAFELWHQDVAKGAPVWVVYPKGRGKPLSEAQVRTALRSRGMVDTKVASVSAELTALRFCLRTSRAPEKAAIRRSA